MKITFKQLNLFIATANSGSLSRGAEEVFLSQPAASVALVELESRLGQPLFDRTGKKLVLNENGLQLYPKAVELIERLNHAEQLFSHKATELGGTLKIGTSMTIGNYIAPPLLAFFMKAYPNVRMIQKVANSETIIHDLEKFQLDIGFIESDCFSDHLLVNQWGEDELIIFAAPDHPFAKKTFVTLNQIEQAEWIVRESGSGTREVMEKYIHPRRIRLEVGSTHAIKQLVASSHVLGCASRYALEKELREKTLVKLAVKDCVIKRPFSQIMHKEKYQTDLIKIFMGQFKWEIEKSATGYP